MPFETKTYIVGHRKDIERLIKEHIGVDQSLRPSLDNDVNVEFFTVTRKDRSNAEDITDMTSFIDIVLDYLAFKGIIETGEYMIHGGMWRDTAWNYDDIWKVDE